MTPIQTLCLWALLSASPAPGAPQDEGASIAKEVRPSGEELEWESLAWRSTLGDAVLDAHRDGKPILLWAALGHPLGCT